MKKTYLLIILLIISCKSKIEMQERTINKNGEIISYNQMGKGEVLIFIHAGGLNKEMWNNQVKTFGKNNFVVAYDVRGHGNSINPTNANFEITDLISILKMEKIDRKVNLIGCSLGAIIALDFALEYPDKVNKLVLISPGLIGFQENNEEYLKQLTNYGKAIQSNSIEEMKYCLKKMNAIGEKNRKLELLINNYVDNQLNLFIESNNHLRIPKIKELKPLKKLAELNIETLLMYGELDFEYIKKNAKKLNSEIPNSKLVKIKDAAHLLNLEDEIIFNDKLSEFIY